MRWLITLIAAFVIFNSLQGWLRRIGLGRLPGDLEITVRGRVWTFPFGSTVLLSLIAWLVARLL
jgi:hypothetical protein